MPERKRPCGKCGLKRQERFFKTKASRICQPCQAKHRAYMAKDRRLRETYGISMEDYEALMEAQDGVCAICLGSRKVLDVDHNHHLDNQPRETVRGLLCRRCNKRLLPAARDNVDILGRAIDYLDNPPAWTVL